jgi:pilus assembly protein CpaE
LKRSIVICPDEDLARQLEAAVATSGSLSVTRIVLGYPTPLDLVRTLRAHAPDIVFLNFESADKAQEIVKVIEAETPGVQIVAIAQHCDAALLRESMRVGIREFLAPPFDRQSVREGLQNVFNLLEQRPVTHEITSQIFTFVPSKAGVGTSTIAMNVSAAMARKLGLRVLLSDFDLNSGMMRFLLKLENSYSVIDAVHHSVNLDEELLPQLVTSLGKLDVIHAGTMHPNLRVESGQVRGLVDFARRNYQVLCFDVSGNLEKYSLELMRESRRVLLVCTQEIPSLHLAREKMAFLRQMDLDSRVSVLLNRCYKRPLISPQQVEDLLGVPVMTTFPNDYHGVNSAMSQGTWVKPESDLGQAFEAFAGELLEIRAATPTKDKKKFLEFFTVPARPVASGQKQ